MKKSLLIMAIALAAISAGIVAQQNNSLSGSFGDSRLPEIILPDLTDKQRNINEWQGKVIIINFWATWCAPCLKEIPEFIKLQQELGAKGLQFIGIAIEEKAPVEKFVQAMKTNYPMLLAEDTGVSISVKLGNIIQAVPYSVVIDRKGNVVHSHPGEFSRQKILEIVTPLL